MIPYIAYVIFMIFCCFCDISTTPLAIKRILYVLFLIITIALVGLRDSSIGFDTVTYFESFVEQAEHKPATHNFEAGYLLLVSVFQTFSTNPHFFLLVITALSIGIKFYALPRYSPMIFIPLVYYMAYYLTEYEMSGIRQSLALAFGLLAIYYAKERRLYVFSAIIILGSFIHVSLLFFFPFYFFDRINITLTTFALLIVSCVALLLVDLTPVIWKAINILPAGSIITLKVSSYMADKSMQNGISFGHLPYLLFAMFFFYYSTVIKDKFYQHIFAAFVIGVFASFLLSSTLSVLNRLSYYYLVTGGILFAYIIYYSQHKVNKLVYVLLLSVFMVLKIMESILSPEALTHYVPYSAFFL